MTSFGDRWTLGGRVGPYLGPRRRRPFRDSSGYPTTNTLPNRTIVHEAFVSRDKSTKREETSDIESSKTTEYNVKRVPVWVRSMLSQQVIVWFEASCISITITTPDRAFVRLLREGPRLYEEKRDQSSDVEVFNMGSNKKPNQNKNHIQSHYLLSNKFTFL